jgi:outer membrane protein assembly factor BamD (BamD/ComL family)
VLVGGVTVHEHGGEPRELGAGGRDTMVAPTTRVEKVAKHSIEVRECPVPATAAELSARAQEELGAGKLAGAVATYEELVRRYPRTSEGRNALVALGQLELTRRNRPAAALRWLDRYLATGEGVLAQEASYYEIEALRALGRTSEARRASEAYLERYPKGTYAAVVSRRLQLLPRGPRGSATHGREGNE